MLRAHLESIEAEEMLNSGRGANLTAAGLKQLVLVATGDEKQANDAFSRRREEQLARGEK